MTRVEAAEVVLEIQDVRVQEFDAPRQPLSALEERSRVLTSVTFKIGGLDVAAWVERSVGDVDLSSWIQSLTVLLLDLRTPGGRHLLFEHETEDPLVLHRRGRRLSVHVGGQEIAACSHAELQAAVEAALASVQAKLEAAGERGKLYWADAHDVLDPGWLDLEEEAFFASRHSWMWGPFFETRLDCPDPESIRRALMLRPDCNQCLPMEGIGQRWVCTPPGLERRVGFLFGDLVTSISFPPRQMQRSCRLPEADARTLWPDGPCPTPQARVFLRWLVGLIQDLSTTARIDSAVLVEEGSGDPSCGVEPGWVYLYSWADIGEPTSDPDYRRAPLRRP